MAWQAKRSSGSWHETVTRAVASVNDPDVLQRFLSIDIGMEADTVMSPETDPWLTDEKKRLSDYFSLLIELGAARSWSQIQFQSCQPNSLAACLHPDRAIAHQMLQWTKRTWTAILDAEKLIAAKKLPIDTHNRVKNMLEKDVCWQSLQVARESYLILEQESWNVDSPGLMDYLKGLFGAPANTKVTLEDLFAHLTSLGKLTSLATAMNKSLDCTWHH